MAVFLAHPEGHAAIQRFGAALRICDAAQIGKWRRSRIVHGIAVCWQTCGPRGSVGVNEAGQIDSFVPSEVRIGCPVGSKLLFEGYIRGVDAWVSVIAVKDGHARTRWKCSR